jgi:ribonuclease P protein component
VGKIAVVVDTKISKKAVERNLVKRRIRAALREIGAPAGELIVRALKGAETLSYPELRDQLTQCLRKVQS